MGIKVTDIKKNNISAVLIIAPVDDSLDWENDEMDWDEYTKTLDESHLRFVADTQPTRFLCNFDLSDKNERAIKNNLMSGKDSENMPTVAFGDWSAEVVRRSLKEIQQPDYYSPMEKIPFKTDKHGFVHSDTMQILQKAKVVETIFAQYTRLTGEVRGKAKN